MRKSCRPNWPIIMAAAATFLLLLGCSVLAIGQTAPLAPGTVYNVAPETCPGTGWAQGMVCYSANVACPGANPIVAPIQLDFGVLMPTNPSGLIVLFSGGDGISPSYDQGDDAQFATAYYKKYNYTAVQTMWGGGVVPWEQANGSADYNVLQSACRPAAFLYWARYNTNPNNGPILFPTTQGAGMCAQGFSAGSAALGYVLAWYGGANYIDKVELLAGPIASDIAQGCVVPAGPPQNICQGSPSYCQGWQSGTGGLSEEPSYKTGVHYMRDWTGDNSCRGTQNTTQQSYSNWLAQSIVNGPSGGGGTFFYPNTSMQSWLCQSDVDGDYNESAPQGWIFYSQVAAQGAPPHFNVIAVGNLGQTTNACTGPEGVIGGYISSTSSLYANQLGFDAISTDMADLHNSQTIACQKLH